MFQIILIFANKRYCATYCVICSSLRIIFSFIYLKKIIKLKSTIEKKYTYDVKYTSYIFLVSFCFPLKMFLVKNVLYMYAYAYHEVIL